MGQIAMELAPPLWWQEFQELTLDLARYMWPSHETMDIYGRVGQRQDGVDVFVQRREELVGIQCKRRRQAEADRRFRTDGVIAEKDIREIVNEAKEFEPSLNRFIVATTGLRDAALQDAVIQLNKEHRSSKGFAVEVWTWDRLEIEITNHPDLLYRHYELVLKSRKDYDRELHLLCVARTAFTRPAFDTPLMREDRGPDFREALLDTQNAITTGTLVDREFKDRIIDRAPIGISDVTNEKWRKVLEKVREKLQEIRETYRTAIAQRRIEEWRGGVRADAQIAGQIDELRADAIRLLNKLLAGAGLAPVSSRLISTPKPAKKPHKRAKKKALKR
jgi:hypothetical protein